MAIRFGAVVAALFVSGATLAEAPDDAAKTAAAQWGKGMSEWNMPKDMYITGDPLILSEKNMNSGERITFVACPYIRDSEPTPLWLADYKGKTYFLRAQQNMTSSVLHPQFKHKVLVEGIISKEPKVAGGIVLNPLYLSVLPELDLTCQKMLPPNGSKIGFAKRPPGPGGSGTDRRTGYNKNQVLADRVWAKDYKPDPVERVRKTFEFRFDFDNGTLPALDYFRVLEVVKYARDVEASKIEIIGTRSAVKLSDGTTLVEHAGVEQERSENIEAIFRDHPIDPARLVVRPDRSVQPANGISDFANRKVTIIVSPAEQMAVAAH